MNGYTLGIDFGTESARAVLVRLSDGEVVATASEAFQDGVIDTQLPGTGRPLPPDWALQNPADWLNSLEKSVRAVMAEGGVPAESVVGIGIDFTACTVLPTTATGTPLSETDAYRENPHAWTKLWKHHAAQPQAERVTELAAQRGESWLPRYGGKVSSEWLIPKALQLLEEAPEIYESAKHLVEGSDWVVWQLTGTLARNVCSAGYKGTWHEAEGYPTPDFLETLHPNLADLYQEKMAGPMRRPGAPVGTLTATWAGKLGLTAGVPVAAAVIDAHAGVPGAGVTEPGVMFMAMGTSTCHMLMAQEEVLVEGISGVVKDGIVPGLYGYEAGQAGVGDVFAWFVENGVPPAYHREAEAKGISLHELLSVKAAGSAPGESGLLALDWWNGNRSTLVDAELSGLIVGLTLATKPEELYRALIEATAFGTRVIVEAFSGQGLPVDRIVAGGGLTKNELLMQIYADVTGQEIAVAGSGLASALGAAMLGAVAAGREGGGYDSLAEASARMAPHPEKSYRPIEAHRKVYDMLYEEYVRLYDDFGRGKNPVMKRLRRLRRAE